MGARLRWTDREIRRVLREVSRKGGDLRFSRMQRRWPGLVYRALKRFETWERTLRWAGLAPAPRRRWTKWSREAILKEIRRLGPPLSSVWMNRRNRSLMVTAYRYYRTWRAAVRAAGFDYEKVAGYQTAPERRVGRVRRGWRRVRKWSREVILSVLRDRSKRGLSLLYVPLRREVGSKFCDRARDHFGGLQRAVEAAGLRYESPIRRGSNWGREDILGILRKGARLGLSGAKEFEHRYGGGLRRAVERTFGSWERALGKITR